MPRQSFSQLVTAWHRLLAGLAKEPLESLGDDLRRIVANALEEISASRLEMRTLRAEMHGTARRQREATARGKAAERRLRALLRGRYGDASTALLRFGMRPRRPRSRPDPKRLAETAPERTADAPAAKAPRRPAKPKRPPAKTKRPATRPRR